MTPRVAFVMLAALVAVAPSAVADDSASEEQVTTSDESAAPVQGEGTGPSDTSAAESKDPNQPSDPGQQ